MPRLLFADDHLLVYDKPAGMLAVPGRGADKQDCLSTRAQARYPDARVVHRLDQATSGLLVLARGLAAQRALSRAFAERRVEKRYIALVAGRLAPPAGDWGVIDLPLRADWPNRPRQCVDLERGKSSLTHWRVLGTQAGGQATRLELAPVTGRSHQLRVHLRALGHPILGDRLYQGPEAARLYLHAWTLGVPHPGTGTNLLFECLPTY
ncbi:MAG: RluA family pseudouridine synthase [Pseudomonadota bacterium]